MKTKALQSLALSVMCVHLACDADGPVEKPGNELRAGEPPEDNQDAPEPGLASEHEIAYQFEETGHVLSEVVELTALADQDSVTVLLRTPVEPTPFAVYDEYGDLVGESEFYAELVDDDDDEQEEGGGTHYFTKIELNPEVLERMKLVAEVPEMISLGYLLLCDEVVTNRASAGTGSLRRAVAQVRDGGSVCFDPVEFSDVSAGPVVLAREISTAKDLSIWAPSPGVVGITTQHNGRIFSFDGDATLRHMRLFEGSASEGGLVRTNGALSVLDATLDGGEADRGGAIYVADTGSLRLDDAAIGENQSVDHGGGVYTEGPATIVDSTIAYNNSGDLGGGLYLGAASTLSNSSVSHNVAYNGGGGLFGGDELRLDHGTFVFANQAYMGAGIEYWAAGHTLTIDGASVNSNVAIDDLPDGEGLQRARGGGIYAGVGAVDVVSDPQGVGLPPAIGYNRAVWGGGVFVWWYGALTVRGDASVLGNSARLGGGILNTNSVELRDQAILAGNRATEDGGGLYNAHQANLYDDVRVADNVADDLGGGAYNDGDMFLWDSTIRIVDNRAGVGGGVYNDDSLSYLQGTPQISSNTPDDVFEP